jgi:hypothetical protein
MLERYAQGFFRMGEVMQRLTMAGQMAEHLNRQLHLDDNGAKVVKELDNLRSWCEVLKLDLSMKAIDRAKPEIQKAPAMTTLNKILPEVSWRVFDELDSVWFLDIPKERLHCYANSQLFGEDVTNKIAGIDTDIAEAGSCFATGRFTACVFHLMRVMERSVQEFGGKLGIQLTNEKNWHNILEEINKAIRALNPQTTNDKETRDNYSAASAHLHNVKEAWRNRVMHPKSTYTDEEAKAILDNVRTFIVHLVTNIL